MPAFTLMIFILTGLVQAQTIIPGGSVGGSWTVVGSPYLITGDVTIPSDQSLQIEPGVEVLFQGYYYLRCQGQLLAVGTAEDSIIFTADDTLQPWDGIDFVNTDSSAQDSSHLAFCELSYGQASRLLGPEDFTGGGVLNLRYSSRVSLLHCLVALNHTADVVGLPGQNGLPSYVPDSGGTNGSSAPDTASGHGGAIYALWSAPIISHCTFRDNRTGTVIGGTGGWGGDHFSYSGTFDLYGGDGASGGDAASGAGGAIFLDHASAIITDNVFFNNRVGDAQGGVGGQGGLADCIASPNNYSQGGDAGQGGVGIVGAGGVICGLASDVFIRNNLFDQNIIGDAAGGSGGDGGDAISLGVSGYAQGGNGGNGGNAAGGMGEAIYIDPAGQLILENSTFTGHNLSLVTSGLGGAGGSFSYQGTAGDPGLSGTSFPGSMLIAGLNVFMANCIVWGNEEAGIDPLCAVNYCDLQVLHIGVGNFVADPHFVNLPLGHCFLSQLAAGQTIQSPCVNAGGPDSLLQPGSTRTDYLPDTGVVDMGFHHLPAPLPMLTIDPLNLEFTASVGGTLAPVQNLRLYNYGIGLYNYSVSENAGWLSVSPIFGGPVPPVDTITVAVDQSGLVAGQYTAAIIITAPGAAGNPQTIPVTLNLSGAILLLTPDSVIINAQLGTNPYAQSLQIANIGEDTLDFTIIEAIPWLTASPETGQSPPTSTVSLSADISGLPVGMVEGDVIVVAPGAANSPDTIHIMLNILEQYPLIGPLSGILQGRINYEVNGNIWVAANDSLIIQPDATLRFNGDFHFDIFGYLHAVGTPEDSIRFLPAEGLQPAFYLEFKSSASDSNALGYCLVTGATSTALYDYTGVRIFDSSPSLTHCTISYNSYGGVVIQDSSNARLSFCLIQGNTYYSDGAGLKCGWSSPIIDHCVFRNNVSQNLGGAIFCSMSDPMISNCDIVGNAAMSGGGLYLTYNSQPIIYNTIIAHNAGGAGISGAYNNASIEHCDLFGNAGGNLYGAAPAGLGLLSTINLNGDSCDLYNNIFLDPQFVDLPSGNFSLFPGSPCIDAGDPSSPLDPDSTLADLGAFYFDQISGRQPGIQRSLPNGFCLEPVRPNPFNPATEIRYRLPGASHVKLRVYNISGKLVEILTEGWRDAGEHQLTFNGSRLASGMYFVKLQAGESTGVQKMILLK
jgi:parallel beta-helix repeat protein/predicted outer membrane repeat protein